MQHRKEGVLSDLPTNQDSSKSVHPTVSALDDPSTSSYSRFADELLLLLAATADVQSEEGTGNHSWLFVVVPFVETEVLWGRGSRLRSRDRDTLNGFVQELVSLQFAPATVSPTGTPASSVRRLRLVPSLPRSVGCVFDDECLARHLQCAFFGLHEGCLGFPGPAILS
jgi:hypothetical protein